MMAAYCVHCGLHLEMRPAFGRERPVCPGCGHVHFDDPKVAAGVLAEDNGRILLVRRGHDPMLGRWSFPSGYVDSGEVVEDAAIREVEEETGAIVTIERLLGVYSTRGEPVIFVAFAGAVTGGILRPGDEVLEARYFDPAALPDLAFPHDPAIVAAWRATRPPASPRVRA